MTRRDADLRALVSYNIKRANSATRGGVERVLSAHGLRRTTYSALSVICGSAGLSQAELAETLAIERPNMTQIVEELLRAGLVDRSRAKADRRAYALTCTVQGAERLGAASADLRAHDAALVARLTGRERDALVKALQQVETASEEVWRDDPVSAP